MSPDTRELRNTLGMFATGVTVVTVRAADQTPIGITVNSFSSVSLDPPLVLWSLAKTSRTLEVFTTEEHWAVNILSEDQEAISNRFASSEEDKFAGTRTEDGIGGVPLLTGCVARLQCRTVFRYEGGDHIILVGEVLASERAERPPLVFHGGRYVKIQKPAS
jgi:3-hydroxy-9,10-secoandrosta-1,3,5(10)-triene-9,17-dione monooxygenase reductase component